jgi:hypothetical protein
VKTILGGMCLVLGLLSAGGLLCSMGRLAWFPGEGLNGPVAFLGFWIPMVLLGGAVGALWGNDQRLLKCLGWVCTGLGFIWALGLLALVAGWAGLLPGTAGKGAGWSEVIGLFLGFFIPMLVCGGAGIGIVVAEAEKAPRAALKKRLAIGLAAVGVGSLLAIPVLWVHEQINEETKRQAAQEAERHKQEELPQKHREELQKSASDKYKNYLVGTWQVAGGDHDGATVEFTKAGNVVLTSKGGAAPGIQGAYGFKHEGWPENADVWLYPPPGFQNTWYDYSVFYQIDRLGDDEMKLERVHYYHDSQFSTFTGSRFKRLTARD